MNGKGRTRQFHAWSFAAATVPAVMTCAGIAWPWVLAGCAAAAAFYFLLGLLRRRTGMSLTESYTTAFGNFIGRLLLGLTAVWTLLALARTASGAAAAFPEGDGAGMAPAVYSKASDNVVLPASTWARIPSTSRFIGYLPRDF